MHPDRQERFEGKNTSAHMDVRIPTFSSIREKLRNVIVANFWYDTTVEPSRVYRPPSDEKYGPGAMYNMSLAASWMSSGPAAPREETNIVAIRNGADESFKRYMQSIGVLGANLSLSFQDFPALSHRYHRRIYNVDDLPDAWNRWSMNSANMHRFVNTKKNTKHLSRFAAPYEVVHLERTTAADFERVGNGGPVYVKTNNTENTGDGVFKCDTPRQYVSTVTKLYDDAMKHGLDLEIVLQPRIEGDNRSFQFFLDPSTPETIDVLSISRQLIEEDGKTYLGNENPPLTPELLTPQVRAMMTDMAQRIRTIDPQTFGFIMCDYFQLPDGRVLAFDPGLRPSGNTATILSRMYLEEQLSSAGYRSEMFAAPARREGMSFKEYVRPIDAILGPQSAARDGHCVLPWGYNHVQGKALLIALSKTRDGIAAIVDDVQETLRS